MAATTTTASAPAAAAEAVPAPRILMSNEGPTQGFEVGRPYLSLAIRPGTLNQEWTEETKAERIATIAGILKLEKDTAVNSTLLNRYMTVTDKDTSATMMDKIKAILPLPFAVTFTGFVGTFDEFDTICTGQNEFDATPFKVSTELLRFYTKSWFALQKGDIAKVYAASLTGKEITYNEAQEGAALPDAIHRLLKAAETDVPNDVLARANLATEYAGVDMVLVKSAVAAVLIRSYSDRDSYYLAALVVSASLVSNKPERFIKKCREKDTMTNALTQISIMMGDGTTPLPITLSRVGRAMPEMRYRLAKVDFDSGKPTHLQKIDGVPEWAKVLCYSGSVAVLSNDFYLVHRDLMAAISMCLGLVFAGNLKDAGAQAESGKPWTVHYPDVVAYNDLINGETVSIFEEPEGLTPMSLNASLDLVQNFARKNSRPHYVFNNPYNRTALQDVLANVKSVDVLRMEFEAKLAKAVKKIK